VRALAHLAELVTAVALVPVVWLRRLFGWRPDRVVIVGWWGSETVGDVAILGQLLIECEAVVPGARLALVSFDHAVSRETLRELQRPDVDLLRLGPLSGWAAITARGLIHGGGPLMESPSMRPWALRAWLARAAGAPVVIYACGIGPVRSHARRRAIASLLRASTHVALRDQASLEWDSALAGRKAAVLSFDPAFDFARGIRVPHRMRQAGQLALALREPPAAYLADLDPRESIERFLDTLADALNRLGRERHLTMVGLVMHTGFAESDDHTIYERLRTRLEHPDRLQVASGRHRVTHVVTALETSSAALTVRFHALIFALATQTPVVAIDYARPQGKASAAAALVGRSADVVTWDALDSDALAARLRAAMGATQQSVDLHAARDARLGMLRDALVGP
jgi:polysaccharide pyruvyl transferase WcaK-like protein